MHLIHVARNGNIREDCLCLRQNVTLAITARYVREQQLLHTGLRCECGCLLRRKVLKILCKIAPMH